MAYTKEERFAVNCALERIRTREKNRKQPGVTQEDARDLMVIGDLITMRLEAEEPHEESTLADAALYLRYLAASYQRLKNADKANACWSLLIEVQCERVASFSQDSESLADDLFAAAMACAPATQEALVAKTAPYLGEENARAITTLAQSVSP